MSVGVVGIINGALEEILIDTSDVMVSLDLASHVVAVESEGTNVLLHLVHRLQTLHHLGSFVQHVLPRRHRRSDRLGFAGRYGLGWFVTGSHGNQSVLGDGLFRSEVVENEVGGLGLEIEEVLEED